MRGRIQQGLQLRLRNSPEPSGHVFIFITLKVTLMDSSDISPVPDGSLVLSVTFHFNGFQNNFDSQRIPFSCALGKLFHFGVPSFSENIPFVITM